MLTISRSWTLATLAPRPRRPAADRRRARLGAFALALASLTPMSLSAQSLSPEERRIAAFAEDHREEAIALLERVVNIKSTTQDLAGVREVGEVFAAEFRRLGFRTRWESMPPEMRRAGHLVAERAGARGKRLLLIGHLDTVLDGRRFERDGSRATGSGALDMKGGDVILLFALKALESVGALEGRRIIVALTGDEEDAGEPFERSRAVLRELARRSDAALAFEAAAGATATVGRRGVSSWTLSVTGKTGHSAGISKGTLGDGAIFEAARILEEIRRDLHGEAGLSFNASLFLGGTDVDHAAHLSRGTAGGKRNVVPRRAVVEGDLRSLSDEQRKEAEARMRAIVARHLPKTEGEIRFAGDYPAMAATKGNLAILGLLDQTSRDLGLGPVTPLDPVRRGAGDISFVATLVDGLDGLGARGDRAHAPEEWIDLASLPSQIQRASLLIDRLSRP